MTAAQCAQCHKDDKIAKVTAIVSMGTQASQTSSVGLGPSLQEDGDIGFSFTFTENSQVSQTQLAKQLSFPDKNLGGMVGGWIVTAICLVVGLVAKADLQSVNDTASKTGITQALITAAETDSNLIDLAGIGLIISLVVATWCTGGFFFGRTTARIIWERLYYCSRCDIVYVPGESWNRAPACQMRRILLY